MAIFAVSGATALVLECDFKEHRSYWGLKYACVAKNLKTTLSDRKVTEVTGTHLDGKTNKDVKKVLIQHQNCPYLPTNLGSHFENLEVLYVMKSNVSHLTNDDLTGLKLKIFDVSYNPIKRLHKDYFNGQDLIEIISFYDCELNYVEKGVLDPLVNLKEGHFQFNECVDYRGDDEGLLGDLRQELAFCDPKHGPAVIKDYDVFQDSDYDFTTKASKAGKIRAKMNNIPEKVAENQGSFLRRNAYVITSLLLFVVVALLGLLYKLNAFNRQSWR